MTMPEFGAFLSAGIPVPVWHDFAQQDKMPYCVWSEYGDSRLPGNGRTGEIMFFVQIDFYTKKEFDPVEGTIRDLLAKYNIAYEYSRTTEDEGRIVHHIFDCDVH